jgi:hypothetical protein
VLPLPLLPLLLLLLLLGCDCYLSYERGGMTSGTEQCGSTHNPLHH